MTDVYAQPGTEKYVKFAKSRLIALGQTREGIRLDVMRKHYVPEPGVRIDIESSVYGDRIRIFGGVTYPAIMTLPDLTTTIITGSTFDVGSNPLVRTATIYLQVNDVVIESYTGTETVSTVFGVTTDQTLTFADYPGGAQNAGLGLINPASLGSKTNGTYFSSSLGAGSIIDHLVVTPIPGFGDAQAAAHLAAQMATINGVKVGVLPPTWATKITASNPMDPVKTFDEVRIMPFSAVRDGVLIGPWPEFTTGITELEVYGYAVYSYDRDADEYTFRRWVDKPSRVPSPEVADPTQFWPGYNCVVTYAPVPGTLVERARQVRVDMHDPNAVNYNPYMAVVLDAVD